MGLALTELDTIAGQTLDKLSQAIAVKANVIDTPRTQRTCGRVVHILLVARRLQIGILMCRVPSLTDM